MSIINQEVNEQAETQQTLEEKIADLVLTARPGDEERLTSVELLKRDVTIILNFLEAMEMEGEPLRPSKRQIVQVMSILELVYEELGCPLDDDKWWDEKLEIEKQLGERQQQAIQDGAGFGQEQTEQQNLTATQRVAQTVIAEEARSEILALTGEPNQAIIEREQTQAAVQQALAAQRAELETENRERLEEMQNRIREVEGALAGRLAQQEEALEASRDHVLELTHQLAQVPSAADRQTEINETVQQALAAQRVELAAENRQRLEETQTQIRQVEATLAARLAQQAIALEAAQASVLDLRRQLDQMPSAADRQTEINEAVRLAHMAQLQESSMQAQPPVAVTTQETPGSGSNPPLLWTQPQPIAPMPTPPATLPRQKTILDYLDR